MKTLPTTLLAVILGITSLATTTHGDEPDLVPRRIGFLVQDGSPIPDFESEKSIALVVQHALDPGFSRDIHFIEFDETGTPFISTWAWIPVQYVCQGGTKYEGTFYCELTPESPLPPAPGALTFLGPDGLIIDSEPYRIKTCQAGDDCDVPGLPAVGKFYFSPITGTGTPFVVLNALFLER